MIPQFNPEVFAQRLAEIRERRGLTQERLGWRCKLMSQTICHFERGRRVPCLRNLMKLCSALNCTPNDLLL